MTFEMQKDDKITFCWSCFRTRYYSKRQFPKDGVRRVVFYIWDNQKIYMEGPVSATTK